MSTEIIDFKSKIKELSSSNLKEILQDVLQNIGCFKEVCILLKDVNNDFSLLYSDSLSMPDKAFFSSMLQHDIFNELDLSEEVTITPST